MKLLEQIKTLSVFPQGVIDISRVFDIICLIFTTCTLLGWVDATIADLTIAKVDAVDGVAQAITNVTPHVAPAYN